MRVGQRVELTATISALGTTARPGDQGVIREVHVSGHLTVRMDDGRVQFPTLDEVTPAAE
ncbi:hypothetical protein ACH4CE_35530 [Streptomyces gelaticus]|uniref:hypothetical protein n=1 Tax=Streptomyces gelaticus TaxID=285446 RepID=UPI0037A60700